MAATVQQMLADIRRDTACYHPLTGVAEIDTEVLQALLHVPREAFVPEALQPQAYENRPLPIGKGQTISQPFIVALMTQLVQPRPEARILEIGTGCGYQAAILAELVDQVYTLEIIDELSVAARKRLQRLGYDNIHARCGDGYEGWAEAAPFDGILVAAATPNIPTPLTAQLAPGGRLVLPVGPAFGHQELWVVEKDSAGTLHRRATIGVAFVPLTGALGIHIPRE